MTITESGPKAGADEHTTVTEPGETIDLTGRTADIPARPTFTITDAAAACAVSRKTITRKLGDLALHGAAKDDDGIWRIPVEALLAVGLHPGRSLPSQSNGLRPPAPTQPAATTPSPMTVDPTTDVVTVPRQRWDDLRIRLARAEAEASERALALADARLALRALTAGPSRSAEAEAFAPPAQGGPMALEPLGAVAAPTPAPPAHTREPVAIETAQEGGSSSPATPQQAPDQAAQLAAARTHAAQNGGYVPATPTAPARKRRWWQSK